MKYFSLYILLFFLLASCRVHDRKIREAGTGNLYSKKFTIKSYSDFSLLTIFDPWQDASGQSFTMLLRKDKKRLPDSLSGLTVIDVPVKRVVVFSTTHVGFIAALHEEKTIAGLSGTGYVYNSEIRARIDSGLISEVGYPPAVDYETIVKLQPDLVLLYGLNASVTGISERLSKAGIPSVLIAEYLERHPLGKMEWLKVVAAFYGKEELARRLFNRTASRYDQLTKQAAETGSKPDIMVGLPWKDTWYMAGGKSFTARLISDAGGNYLWKDNDSNEYIPLGLESTFLKAIHADYWINAGTARSLNDIASRDERFSRLPVFTSGQIYNNDARISPEGGNDYWESGVVHPDEILADLIKIFHPDVLRDHSLRYYRKLQ